jgi:hypothetical protein
MKRIVGGLLQILLLVSVATTAAQAEWHSLGKVIGSHVEGNNITFHTERAIVRVSVLAPDIVRVRMSPGSTLGPDYSWAVVKKQWPAIRVEFSSGPNMRVIRTGKLVEANAPRRAVFRIG